MNWFSYQFRFKMQDDANPLWWLDLFVVDTIVRDVLEQYRDECHLWRFHRRAMHDASGHKLSFLCRTANDISESIHEVASSHATTRFLKEKSLLLDYTKEECGSDVEATSDSSWSHEVKKAWPFFIMGVSEMILELITQIKGQHGNLASENDLSSIENYYQSINERFTAIWRNEASHAFLHHFNAMFGYAPVFVQPCGATQGFTMRF